MSQAIPQWREWRRRADWAQARGNESAPRPVAGAAKPLKASDSKSGPEGRVDLLGVTHYEASAFDEVARALRTGKFDAVQLSDNPHGVTASANCCRSRPGSGFR